MTHAGGRSRRRGPDAISLLEVAEAPGDGESRRLTFLTDQGDFPAIYHPTLPDGAPGPAAVVWVGGARGGIDGPAGSVYADLSATLRHAGISSLRLDYRHPGALRDCVMDVLVGLAWLQEAGVQRAALVGHSFGGAAVITAGALSPLVRLVVTLASQTYGADLAATLSPKRLLVIHGMSDAVLPARCSRAIFAEAREPKELVLYEGAGHSLDEAASELRALLADRITRALAPDAPPG